jgi:AcrR family transcriptional regulator
MTLTPRQKEILEASLHVIDTEGLKKFTMKNVAQRIGVTDAALYKHFPDKGAILGSLQTLFKETTLDILAAIHADPLRDALGKLEVFVKGRARQFQENRALTVTLFSDELFRGMEAVSSLNQDTMDSHADILMAIIREGQAAGSLKNDIPPAHMVMLLTGPMRLMVTGWKADPSGKPTLVERVDNFWGTYAKIVKA